MKLPGASAPRDLLFAGALAAAVLGCAQEEYPVWLYEAQHPAADASAASAAAATPKGSLACTQARATPLPVRLVVMSAGADAGAPSATTYTVSQVYEAFLTACGQCHGPTAINGNFQITSASSFQTTFTQDDLYHVLSNGPPNPNVPAAYADPMPPFASGGEPFSSRGPTDPVYQFAMLAQAWIDAGSPSSFTESAGDGGTGDGAAADADSDAQGGAAGSYTLPPSVGNAMTNIGDCIPSPALIGTEQTRSAELDAMFAAASWNPQGSTAAAIIGLPEHLGETDLFTLDTETLAQYGVIAYAPGYPLWSDDAGKLRYVRVPRGTSISFDKETQQFTIPPNTRFYKTFTKQIIDTDGSIRWRKIETRLIVARPATAGLTGPDAQNAVFGTYLWNDDETDAVLLDDSERDGLPWGDDLLQYNTDEQLAAEVEAAYPNSETELLLYDAVRHYAVPSRERCIECHEGSANQDFVLGFLPLQINRRPVGQGGVIEPTGPDELTQLQRFIDYGLITGMDSPADVLPLEQSEGARTPRPSAGNYELVAQGYMLGNCSHCHNPNGAPSIQQPLLVPLLDFLPGPDGGIFQFPLERYSPDMQRGPTSSTLIPFITPSLMDQQDDLPTPSSFSPPGGVSSSGAAQDPIYAPWRSFIYRNVDTAFTYADDSALFPHMPRDTPGYDPRAHQILGDWMVSIPALPKNPQLSEYTFCSSNGCSSGPPDSSPQPYAEVPPGDPRYEEAVAAAEARLEVFHTGLNPAVPLASGVAPYSRYAEMGVTADIVDPETLTDPVCHPIPTGQSYPVSIPPPNHPDWVVTDITEAAEYSPRRPDWADVLVGLQPETGTTALSCPGGGTTADQNALADEDDAIAALQGVTLDPTFVSLATTAVPFGLWSLQNGCDYSDQPTTASLAGGSQPAWMTQLAGSAALPPNAPVYSETPGQAVFKAICINCHGALANATGLLAANLADMSGGLDIVADFRDGFMGPVGSAESASNRHQWFGPAAVLNDYADGELDGGAPNTAWTNADLTDDDNASRYMAWMALGGTKVEIPVPILDLVADTPVLGQRRSQPPQIASANMLSVAKAICYSFMNSDVTFKGWGEQAIDPTLGAYPWAGVVTSTGAAAQGYSNSYLITTNGDAENWFELCTYNPTCPAGSPASCQPGNHPSPVHVLEYGSQAGVLQIQVAEGVDSTPYLVLDPTTFPQGVAVGTADGGQESSLTPDNTWPWCVAPSATAALQDPDYAADFAAYMQAHPSLVLCPAGVVGEQTAGWDIGQMENWAVRGAVNAGLAVFLYVEGLEQSSAPPADFDQCPSAAGADGGAPSH